MLYKRVEPEDGTELQFVGVYVLRWIHAWGEPTVGFVAIDEEAVIESFESLIDHVMAQEEKAEPMSKGEVRVAIRQCLEVERPI